MSNVQATSYSETHVVLPEPSRTVLADVEVRGETDRHPRVDVAVGSASKITDVVCGGDMLS